MSPSGLKVCAGVFLSTHLTTLLRRIPGGLQLTLDVVCLFWNATLQHGEETLNMEKAKFQ